MEARTGPVHPVLRTQATNQVFPPATQHDSTRTHHRACVDEMAAQG